MVLVHPYWKWRHGNLELYGEIADHEVVDQWAQPSVHVQKGHCPATKTTGKKITSKGEDDNFWTLIIDAAKREEDIFCTYWGGTHAQNI